MTLYAVELKVVGTFSSYLMADSQQDAEQEMKRRASTLNPDSVVFEAASYKMEPCELCGEEHFGPACQKPHEPRMKQAAELLQPSWERSQL